MNPKNKIQASVLADFISILYLLCLGYKQIETKMVLTELKTTNYKRWESLIPSIGYCLIDIKKKSEEAREDLASDLKNCLPGLNANQEYTTDELKLIKVIRSWLVNGKDNAWATIVKQAPLYSPFASSILYNDDFDTDSVSAIVELLEENNILSESILLNLEQAKEFRVSKPEAYADYRMLLKDFLASVKNITTTFINSKGGKVKYEDYYDFLTRRGLEYVVPSGFTGLIDAMGNWYSADGKQLDSPLPVTTYPIVEMNPNPTEESQWVAKANPVSSGKTRYLYTLETVKANQKHKFDVVEGLLTDLPNIRKKWLAKIKSFDPQDRSSISSVVLELLFQTAGRVGSVSNTNGTFGINTLLVKHMSVLQDGSISFNYLGKDKVKTKYVIKQNADPINKALIPILLSLKEGKKPSDPIFTCKNKIVSPSFTNQLFKQFAGSSNVNVHKIRTFRGTSLFIQEMEKIKAPTNQAQAVKLWMQLGTIVGRKLNHIRTQKDGSIKVTPKTALLNYIDPSIQIQLFVDNGFRVPKDLEKYL